jgi:hypothetical protein
MFKNYIPISLKQFLLFGCVIILNSQTCRSQTYCKPVNTGSCGLLDIDWVKFNDYSSPGFGSDCYDTTFLSFGSVTTLKAGKTYQYEGGYDIGHAVNIYTIAYGIWIDFNNDGKFDDATELLDSNTIDLSTAPAWKGNLKIPLGVLSGQYRMRLRVVDNSYLIVKKKKNYLKHCKGSSTVLQLIKVKSCFLANDSSWSLRCSKRC